MTISEKFIKFLRAADKKVLNEDQWCNMIEVLPILQESIDKYDAASSCIFIRKLYMKKGL